MLALLNSGYCIPNHQAEEANLVVKDVCSQCNGKSFLR